MSDSIKVAIKVRPLIKRERDDNLSEQWMTQGNTIVATDAELRKRADGRFEFDHIFGTNARNKDVFDHVVEPIVNAAVNGFNGTVFAYGQTSSGKTYTMMGDSEEPGIIPLTVEHMFKAIANTPGREFLLRVSYLEIYKEKVNDLLGKDSVTDLKIHEDLQGQVFVKCKEEVTNSSDNVLSIMHKGNKNRKMGETNMNERSSRSHTIFRITIESREVGADSDGAIQVSQLNLVDLAGSERSRATGATGERFKEGLHINLSLSTLSLVIKQLSESQDGQKYINFRDSKLTRLLQASLGGNALTAIICAVTPAAVDETQCTLSFACRAKDIKNKPELNEVMSEDILLKRYAKQIDKLQLELEKMKQTTRIPDFEEMEFKIQEKERINQTLEERIKLLQTRIVTSANCMSFKAKEKRRRTWCGTGGYKTNASTFQICANLSPIKEVSPLTLSKRKYSDIMNTSFEIAALTDFELDLLNSEANKDENDSDEDGFITYRKKECVKFMDNVIVHKLSSNDENDSIAFEEIDVPTRTTSCESPGTPKKILRDRISKLANEYLQLQEFTTLEKQIYTEEKFLEYQEKLSKVLHLEKQLENITSDKNAFEEIASDLRKKLTAAETRYTLAEDQLNAQKAELQRIPNLEKKIAQLSAQEIEVQNIPELQKQINILKAEKDGYEHVASELRKKLNEAEQHNILLEDKLTQSMEITEPLIRFSLNNDISPEKHELQCKINDLQDKLTEAELNNNLMKDKLDEQQQRFENLQEEKNKTNLIICEMQSTIKEAQETNSLMTVKLNDLMLEVQKSQDQEKEIAQLKLENHEFKCTIDELQEQLIEAKETISTKENEILEHQENLDKFQQVKENEKVESEQRFNELRDQLKEMKNKFDSQEIYIQKTCCLENQVVTLAVEKTEFKDKITDLEENLRETESMNSSLKCKLNEYEANACKIVASENNLTSENTSQQIIFESEGEEKKVELYNDSIQEELNVHQKKAQKSIEERRKSVENSVIERNKLEDTIRELQVKLKEAEVNNSLMKDKINEQELQLQKNSNMEKEKLAQYHISAKDESDGEQLQKILLNTQVENSKYEKNEQDIDNEYNLNNGDSLKSDDLFITNRLLHEDCAKLSAEIILKNQELDEIKHDVQSLKADIENLQGTIYLLTTENSELTNKLSMKKDESAIQSQQIIDELYARNSKIINEKIDLEINIANLNEQLDTLRSRIPEVTSNEEQIIHKYEKQINALTAKNTELSSNIADKIKELEMLKESKSLLYEHDCTFKNNLIELAEKYEHLTTKNDKLSIDFVNIVEENEVLKQERDILNSKLELSIKNIESISDNDVDQLKTENTLLKTELFELKTNMEALTEKNSKMSSQLIETIEDLDNARKLNSYNDTMHLSTLFNDTNDTMNKSMLDENTETIISNMQEKINHLTHLNRKLSDMKFSTCTQCSHLDEINKGLRMSKVELKTVKRKLNDLQNKFNRESAKSDVLISKAKEDLNLSLCNFSFNASFSENMNVSYAEEKLQSLTGELHILKDEYNKLLDLYQGKCNEIEELQNSTIADKTLIDDVNLLSIKKPSRKTLRLDNIDKNMSDLRNEFARIKEGNESVKSDLIKYITEKESLVSEINTLKTANEQLQQKLSESEQAQITADILKKEIEDVTKKFQELTLKYKEIENAKLLIEAEMESLQDNKAIKEQTINDLRQSRSCLEHELESIKKEKDNIVLAKQEENEEYKKKLELLITTNEELIKDNATISEKFTNYSKESENRLTELNEKISKCTSENDYLKQEMIKLRDIENKFEKMKSEYNSKSQQDKTLADDNKKLKNLLNEISQSIIKEIKSLKPKVDTQDKSVDELFHMFLQTILTKEEEIVKTMRNISDKEKQKLEDEKRQISDEAKRMSLWAKELECEIEKLQKDLSTQETEYKRLKTENARLEQLLEESNRDIEALREKNSLLETDLNNMQIEYNSYSKNGTVNEEAIIMAQKREKQAQETIRNKEAEFQMKLKSEKEAYNKRIEDLACTLESLKTKNMELTGNIEGLEANQTHLKNIIDLKTNEIKKNDQIIQRIQTELDQSTIACNDLNRELEEKEVRITEVKELLKSKCDELMEYKTNLETFIVENKMLKQQINERKANVEQHKVEIESLKMENERKIEEIKDQLNIEELKNIELNKQITELNNKSAASLEEMNTLRDEFATIQRKCATLEKRVRNSTSKIQAEKHIEELQDLNKSLVCNLEGAGNRITELQTLKADLTKQVVVLSAQYDMVCKDNEELKGKLSSFKSIHNDTYTACDKYDDLLQEKNKIALELEAMKVQLSQKNKDVEKYTSEIKVLTEKNEEFDRELEELAGVICRLDAENAKLQDEYNTCVTECNELQDKIKILEKKCENPESHNRTLSNRSCNNECSCAILKSKIRELQSEVVSKNGKIATLELQIRSGSFPYQTKCKELQEHLSAFNNKNNELKAEIKRLQIAITRTSAKECDICKQRFINSKHQSCQTMPNNLLRLCSTSSGTIDDDIRITKLEKEKEIMKDICRARSKTIKELEKKIAEYENLHSINS